MRKWTRGFAWQAQYFVTGWPGRQELKVYGFFRCASEHGSFCMAFTVRWEMGTGRCQCPIGASEAQTSQKGLLVLIETLSCESFRVWCLQSTCGAVTSRVSRFVFWVYVVLRPRTWQESRQWWPRRFYERKIKEVKLRNFRSTDFEKATTSPQTVHITAHHFVLRSHISPFTCEAWSKRIGFWRFPKDRAWVIFSPLFSRKGFFG